MCTTGSRFGLCDKIHWMPEKMAWGLKFNAAPGADKRYCREHRISMAVDFHATGEIFQSSRREAFDAACRVWNAVDTSGKQRIKADADSGMKIVPVLAISHEGEESEMAGSEGSSESETD